MWLREILGVAGVCLLRPFNHAIHGHPLGELCSQRRRLGGRPAIVPSASSGQALDRRAEGGTPSGQLARCRRYKLQSTRG